MRTEGMILISACKRIRIVFKNNPNWFIVWFVDLLRVVSVSVGRFSISFPANVRSLGRVLPLI